MYDDLVKRMRAQAVYLPEKFSKNAELLDVLMKAADAIEERCQQVDKFAEEAARLYAKQPKWIPVTEGKPKTDDIVIVAIHDDSGDTPYDVTNVGFYLDVSPIGVWVVENERCNYATHWMPLPEPPKEG